jgi:hypothetical protein
MMRRTLTAWYGRLFADNGAVELRAIGKEGVVSGVFDRADALVATLIEQDGSVALYTSLNAPRAVLATNALASGRALADKDFAFYTRLLFDFDPMRPRDTPATEAEVAAAVERRAKLVAYLKSFRWPAPALALSGNGAHALYRLRLPITDENRATIDVLYRGFARYYTDGTVVFDPTTRNPSRITRAYGTLNTKGRESDERRHRPSSIEVPPDFDCVPWSAIERVAKIVQPDAAAYVAEKRPPIAGSGDFRSLDIVSWFTAHGHYKRAAGGGKHYIICPWLAEHSDSARPGRTDTVIWEPTDSSWPTFYCAHQHCDGRSLRSVIALWGDADRFCNRAWERNRG